MDDDRRSVLEAIAFGADPKVTPADRLKALEMLGRADVDVGTLELARWVRSLSDEQLDQELAGFMDAGYQPTPEHVQQMVEQRARVLAEEIALHDTPPAQTVEEAAAPQPDPTPEPEAERPSEESTAEQEDGQARGDDLLDDEWRRLTNEGEDDDW